MLKKILRKYFTTANTTNTSTNINNTSIIKFNSPNITHLTYFRSLLKSDQILSNFENTTNNNNTNTDNLTKYNTDWLNKYTGYSKLVLKPKTNLEVSSILQYCNTHFLSVIPQGGNTGLVGGSVPNNDEVIISLEKMNVIFGVENSNISTVHSQAGVVLATLNSYTLDNFNKVIPLDLGAKGSCFIGGNLATHAGGIHFMQYGSLRNNCMEITAVLANGDIVKFNSNTSSNKSNDRLNLKNIIIGSEGTLGIITECKMKIYEPPIHSNILLLGLQSFEQIQKLYIQSKKYFGNNLTAIEFFDKNSRSLLENTLHMEFPFDDECNFYLLIEVSIFKDEENQDNSEKQDSSSLNSQITNSIIDFLESVEKNIQENNNTDLDSDLNSNLDSDLFSSTLISQNLTQFSSIWQLRERIAESGVKYGICLKYDISLSLENMYSFVEEIRSLVGNKAIVIGYGHIGDYNVHLNVCYKGYEKDSEYYELVDLVEPYIFDRLKVLKGSISAEHGVGQCKTKYLNRTQSEESIDLMKNIKKVFDPKGIMNPYKIFDTNESNSKI